MLTRRDIRNAIIYNKLSGRVISLHSSYKSFGGVEGGADTIIDCFLECGCTLLVPTFTYNNESYPTVKGLKYRQNAFDPEHYDEECKVYRSGFSVERNDISKIMGIIPKLILEREGSFRGNHPLNSFTGIGPKAEKLISKQSYLNVYGPYEECMNDTNAVILLMGIDFTSATPIHFAEMKAGRNMFRSWAYIEGGDKVEVAIGSCSDGFNSIIPVVKDIKEISTVGQSNWQIYNFKSFINRISDEIKKNNNLTHCGDPECIRCRDAVLGGPIIPE